MSRKAFDDDDVVDANKTFAAKSRRIKIIAKDNDNQN